MLSLLFLDVSKICPDKREIVEQAYASLLTFAIHTAQVSAEEDTIREYLGSVCGFKSDRLDTLVEKIIITLPLILRRLASIRTLPPRLIDVNWRLSYIVKVHLLFYNISLFHLISLINKLF